MMRFFYQPVVRSVPERKLAYGVAKVLEGLHPPGYYEKMPMREWLPLYALVSAPLVLPYAKEYYDRWKDARTETKQEGRPERKPS